MPITKSAIKKARQDVKKREHDRGLKSKIKSSVKKFLESATEENFKSVQSVIDRAIKNNIYKKNTAARIKSRLVKLVKKTGQAKKTTKKSLPKETPKKTSKPSLDKVLFRLLV